MVITDGASESHSSQEAPLGAALRIREGGAHPGAVQGPGTLPTAAEPGA